MALAWRIAYDLPNSPNFPSAKYSHYTVIKMLEQKQWKSVSLDWATVYSHNQGSLSTGHLILENDQSNVSDFIGQDLWKQLKGSIFQCF